jgi:neuroligin
MLKNPVVQETNILCYLQSGSALADWAIFEDVYRVQNTSRVFAHRLGCSIDSSWKLVNCLKNGRNFYELGNADFQVQFVQFTNYK